MNHVINIFLLAMLMSSCSTNGDKFVGTYVSENLEINCDTLILNQNRTYIRKLYVKDTKELIYSNYGKWNYSNGFMTLEDFLIDNDRVYAENYDFQEALMEYSVTPNIDFFGNVSFDYGPYLSGKFVYVKI